MTLPGGELHLLRPEWAWLLLPALIACGLLALRSLARHDWQRDVDPELLPWLLVGSGGARRRWPLLLTGFLGALLISIAAVGPSWQKIEVPVMKPADALVIVLDASPSMLAEDVAPSRMQRARFKLADILQARREGQTGLVLYGGDAFVVAPLTDDTRTLLNLLPQLGPDLIPVAGSNPRAAFELARQLLDNTGHAGGRILWITDGIVEAQMQDVIDLVVKLRRPVTVVGVGTDGGAPIPAEDGGFMKRDDGEIIVARLDDRPLRRIASTSGGDYLRLSLAANDLDRLLAPSSTENSVAVERDFDQWQDNGWLFALALLPLCLAGFRRGWLLSLPLLLTFQAEPAQALEWADLWQTPDQRGAEAMAKNAYGRAAKQFEDPQWRAAALYRDGEFESAAEALDRLNSDRAHYNRGNALARLGEFEAAIAAYDAALAANPNHDDARFNKALLEQLMQQQQQQNDKQDQQPNPDKDGADQTDSQRSDSQDQQQSEKQQQKTGDDGEASGQSPQNSQQQQPQNADGEPRQNESESQQAQRQQQQQDAEQQYQQAAAQARDNDEASGEERQVAMAQEDESLSEQQQALEQWLRQVPDNPGGLLKRKFRHQHIQRREQTGEFDRRDIAPY